MRSVTLTACVRVCLSAVHSLCRHRAAHGQTRGRPCLPARPPAPRSAGRGADDATPSGPGSFAAGHTPTMLDFGTPSPAAAPAAPPPIKQHRGVVTPAAAALTIVAVLCMPPLPVAAWTHTDTWRCCACGVMWLRVCGARRALPRLPRAACRQQDAHARQAAGWHGRRRRRRRGSGRAWRRRCRRPQGAAGGGAADAGRRRRLNAQVRACMRVERA
jgi:hypothetical protein